MLWLNNIKYRLWRFDEAANAFDCVWLFKAYAVKRWLLDEQEAWYINSTVMYLLSKPKPMSDAIRWDITYRQPLWDDRKHIAFVSKNYDPSDWWIWIIDNLWKQPKERFLKLYWWVYLWKRKIKVWSNPFVEIANNKWLEYSPLWDYQWSFQLSRYYTPVEWQKNYFLWSYEADFRMNCSGDCTITANGTKLSEKFVEKIIACPPEYPMWTKFRIEDWFVVTCADRWWSIKNKHIDIRAGIWDQWYENIANNKVVTGFKNIYQYTLHSKPINETKTRLYIINSFGDYIYR